METEISYSKVVIVLLVTLGIAGALLYFLRLLADFIRDKTLFKEQKSPEHISILKQKYIDNKRKIVLLRYRNKDYLILLQDGSSPIVLNNQESQDLLSAENREKSLE